MRRGFWLAFVQPTMPAPLAGRREVIQAGLCCVFAGLASDYLHRGDADVFTPSALAAYALLFLAAGMTGWIAAILLQRRAVAGSVWSAMLLACAFALPLIDARGTAIGGDIDPDYGFGPLWLYATPISAFVLALMLRRWTPQASWWPRLIAAIATPVLALWLSFQADAWSSFYYSDIEEDAESAVAERADAALDYDPEDLLALQDGLVDAQIAALLPQRPGQVDLYLVAMAGDGAEDVFRNEVVLATTEFDERFRTAGRSLSLINHVDTLPQVPMATRRNLMRTLEGVGRIIEPAEDIVFVFMTSHGSEQHDWIVQLGDLSLTQITPDDLIEAYDNAGIRWRVSVVSACYSGGYADVLAAPTSLVISAARADRTSFGCGSDADLTYFGRAYFAEALAQTPDFVAAFGIAAARIRKREQQDGFEASEPQLRSAEPIERQLALWRGTLTTLRDR